ncbi:related to transporter protein [Phialocephala subalpina]|uniref:Related to transporter protein n=1 Tax=Phialocephala subalpina TaxID=576137 RepID=A0A1L7XUE4_9HELO|nr:related to transporter protein [Phialocephala subalpina]
MSDDKSDDKRIDGNARAVTTEFESEGSGSDVLNEKKAPWWSYVWDYDPGRPHQEIKFLQKLDFGLLTILSLGYFIKNLDQTNISNAYVSGMKEQLKMNANQLNLIDVAWTTGYVVGQLPSQFILTKVRPSIWIPSCELVWTILTFCLAAATTSNQVIAIRFFVGLVESIFYPAAHFLIGSWYKPSELGKRACIFHASSAAAGMFSGYLQAAVYKGLNGHLGKAGWQWLFIMDGVISTPICLAGFFLIPDLPENTRAFYLTNDDAALARKRMDDVGRSPRRKLGWSILRRVFTRWHVYALTVLYIIFINTGPSSSVSPLALWLKSTGWPVTEIASQSPENKRAKANKEEHHPNRPKRGPTRHNSQFRNVERLPPQQTSCDFFGFFSSLVLAIWAVPSGLKWFAYFISRAAVPYGPLSMSWANEICGADAEERAIVLGVMNASGYAFNAWLPLLTYPVKQAPKFRKGFVYSTCAFVAQFGITGTVAWLHRWEKKKRSLRELGPEPEEEVSAEVL